LPAIYACADHGFECSYALIVFIQNCITFVKSNANCNNPTAFVKIVLYNIT